MIAIKQTKHFDHPLVYESNGSLVRWIATIYPLTRRIKLDRVWLGRWNKTIVDCSFDDCVSIGTVEYNTDGYLNYGTYFKLKNGDWHAIPCKGRSFKAAFLVVKKVSAVTNIARLDIKYS